MDLEVITQVFIVPVLFYIALALFFMASALVLGVLVNPGFLVLGCIVFIMAYAAFRQAWKLKDI